MTQKKITNHSDLAQEIAGKTILHLNSLGKDSVLCLEWLTSMAAPAKIYSVFFEFIAQHPSDKSYLNYLKKRYPTVTFLTEPNPIEIENIVLGQYQTPRDVIENNSFEYCGFSMKSQIAELKQKLGCDYVCSGESKYEGFARAVSFQKKGILKGNRIYPLGLLSKKQVYELLKKLRLPLHPCYKLSEGTYDTPSYWKMRSAFLTNPEFFASVLKTYPMLILDKYRHEKLFKK